MSGERVAVAMSGGVDSSTAAAVLKQHGYDVVGFSMQLWDRNRNEAGVGGRRRSRGCCSIDDLYDARSVAARLSIPFYVVNFERRFEETVVKKFVEDYLSGLTPSPCVLCNSRMKFDQLLHMASEVEARYVATGHYARTERDQKSGRRLLLKGIDRDKDQSYFLFELTQAQLDRAMFPLGALHKDEVRAIARRLDLEIADKPESQEICFVPDGDYASFIERYCAGAAEVGRSRAGEIIGADGRILGRHGGVHRYTIGQRRGLGLAHSSRLYVVALEPDEKKVVVGERALLEKRSCRVINPNWVSIPEPSSPVEAAVKIRSRHREAPAVIRNSGDGSLRIEFETAQTAVSPGQAAVFYQGDLVLGGGWIARDE